MAKTKISEFNANPALNTDIDSINIAEGCAPSGINDAIRELMSQLKDWQSGTSNDPYVVGSSGSLTLNQGTANGVAYLNGSKVVTSGSALTFDGTNLGVGTSSAGGSKLTVQNSSILVRTDGDFLKVNDVADTTYWFRFTRSSSDLEISNRQAGAIKFLTSDSEQMRLTSTGLGIGTSSPTQKLDVNGNIRTSGEVALSGSDFVYSWAGGTTGQRRSGFYLDGTNNVLRFYTNQSEVGRFDSSGNLGIGTSSPASKLHVVGNTRITADIESTGNSIVYSSNGSAAGTINAGIYLVGSDSSSRFYTGNSERMRLDSSGNLGLGVTSPSVRLHAEVTSSTNAGAAVAIFRQNGSGNNGIVVDAASTPSNYVADFRIANSSVARIDSSGNLLVGKTASAAGSVGFETGSNGKVYSTVASDTNSSSTYHVYSSVSTSFRFYVGMGGTVYAVSTSITGISDQRLKENIRDLDDGLEKVMALQPRKFDWKEGKGADIKNARGFIAQEFETVFPDMVEEWLDPAPEGEEPYKAVNANLIPTLVKAIQEQQAIIESLKARLDAANL